MSRSPIRRDAGKRSWRHTRARDFGHLAAGVARFQAGVEVDRASIRLQVARIPTQDALELVQSQAASQPSATVLLRASHKGNAQTIDETLTSFGGEGVLRGGVRLSSHGQRDIHGLIRCILGIHARHARPGARGR